MALMNLREISQTKAEVGSREITGSKDHQDGQIMGLGNSEEKLGLDIQENRESLKVWGPLNCGTRVSEEDEQPWLKDELVKKRGPH